MAATAKERPPEGALMAGGRALVVRLQPATKVVAIRYRTAPDAAAMQWLAPEQTSGGQKLCLSDSGIVLDNGKGAKITLSNSTVSINSGALEVT